MSIYMKVEDAKGNMVVRGAVTVSGYAGWMELQSAKPGQNGRNNPPSDDGPDAESVYELVVTKRQDVASNGLIQQWQRSSVPLTVTVDFLKPVKGVEMLIYSLVYKNVLISNYSVNGYGGAKDDRPLETFTLNYTKVTVKLPDLDYSNTTPQQPVTYDLRQMTAS
jgi:type VI protein secretion system component Hcp